MADRFVKVPTELIEAMYERKFTAGQYKALLYIIRKTYGWGKAKDVISITKMAKDTGMTKRAMLKVATKLEDFGIIEIERSAAGKPNTLRIKAVNQWTPVNCGTPVNQRTPQPVNPSTPLPVNCGTPTIDTLKDNIKKEKPADYNPWDIDDTPEELEAWLNS